MLMVLSLLAMTLVMSEVVLGSSSSRYDVQPSQDASEACVPRAHARDRGLSLFQISGGGRPICVPQAHARDRGLSLFQLSGGGRPISATQLGNDAYMEEAQTSRCEGMPDVERTCAANGCKVLATNMRGKTCADYCARSGRICVGAWEEVEENCEVLANLQCDQTYKQTSDLICECASAAEYKNTPPETAFGAPEVGQVSICTDMPDVERECSSDGCKVLAGSMQGKTCAEYCSRSGRSCVGAWEEVDDNCEIEADLQCDQTYQQTSDLICECTGAAEEPVAPSPSVPREQPEASGCQGMPDIEQTCSSDGCKVLAGNMRGKTCAEYCARSERTCVGAWEEVEENCEVKADLQCDQTYQQTSDLICECSSVPEEQGPPDAPDAPVDDPAPSPIPLPEPQCNGLRNVEEVCSADGCKVRAGFMTGRTCRQYCGDSGLACVGAWEEVDEDCSEKETLSCDDTFPTSDLLCECAASGSSAPSPSPASPSPASSKLVWADEFEGSSVNGSMWSIVNKGGGFGNRELQYYTDRDSNVHIEEGVLKIFARCENYRGHGFTSAKLQSKHKGDWGPGHRVEVRARLPTSKGTWPAIWMLPTRKSYGGWPRSGEIDIVEVVGCTQDKVHGTVHTGTYNHMLNTQKGGHMYTGVASWHTYAIEWTRDDITWFVDGRRYYSFAAPNHRDTGKWPFDLDFFLILNLAVGGTWGGWCVEPRPSCNDPSEFGRTQVMEVDYARVYAL